MNARWLLPPGFLAFSIAVIGSLALHVPAYVGLGILESFFDDHEPPPIQAASVEMEIVETPEPVPEPEEEAEPDEERPDQPAPVEEQAAPQPEPPRPEPQPPPAVAETPPVSQPQPMNRTSVEHRSRDPNVEPPEDAQYLAEENSRVEEEMMANVRSPNANDPEPQASTPDEPLPESELEGDAAEEEVANVVDTEGAEVPDRGESSDESSEETSESRTPREASASQQAQSQPSGGREASGGGERPTETVIIRDATGTYRVRVAVRPEGEGDGDEGGIARAGEGQGRRGEGRSRGRAGRGRGTPSLRMSWTDFTSMYGEEELERDRALAIARRRGHARGANREERWQRFRAAIENYDVQVRPGNQTALNTRADPFAAYVARMHRGIHVQFADGFLLHLPSTVEAAFQTNPEMNTRLEIAIGADGSVASIGVVSTSGDLLFDFGAYNAVMNAAPFGATPENIRSPDGLVYVHWSFYRNQRQCGTFNARMFILAGGGAPAARPPPPESSLLGPAQVFDDTDR
jgi:TonB family protein